MSRDSTEGSAGLGTGPWVLLAVVTWVLHAPIAFPRGWCWPCAAPDPTVRPHRAQSGCGVCYRGGCPCHLQPAQLLADIPGTNVGSQWCWRLWGCCFVFPWWSCHPGLGRRVLGGSGTKLLTGGVTWSCSCPGDLRKEMAGRLSRS